MPDLARCVSWAKIMSATDRLNLRKARLRLTLELRPFTFSNSMSVMVDTVRRATAYPSDWAMARRSGDLQVGSHGRSRIRGLGPGRWDPSSGGGGCAID